MKGSRTQHLKARGTGTAALILLLWLSLASVAPAAAHATFNYPGAVARRRQ
jgi:hypothetical protein